MYAEERRRQIASLTAIEGRVNVTELAARFDVTAETIRRDLAVLDNEGTVHRVHGKPKLPNCGAYCRCACKVSLISKVSYRPGGT